MQLSQRHSDLLDLLDTNEALSVADLAQKLSISEATLRRDLVHLTEMGKVVRTHGGVLLRSSALQEPGFLERRSSSIDEKRLIAQSAVAEIPPGSCVFIDSGTTCLEAARILIGRGDCRLITNSIPVLTEACRENASITAVGGEIRGISRALVGDTALVWLNELRADIALIGASGLDPQTGVFTTEPLEASVKASAIKHAGESWLLADSAKWGKPSVQKYASWKAFRRWFCDRQIAFESPAGEGFPEITFA